MSRVTKATFKSFIKKNEGKLFIQINGDFDGMSDCVEFVPSDQRRFVEIKKDKPTDSDYQYGAERGHSREEVEFRHAANEHTLGYRGIWLVNHSRDSFRIYEDGIFNGIQVYNCCGNFIVAIRKGDS